MRFLIICFFAAALLIPISTSTAIHKRDAKVGSESIIDRLMNVGKLVQQIATLIQEIFAGADPSSAPPLSAEHFAKRFEAASKLDGSSVVAEIIAYLKQHNLLSLDKMAKVAKLIELLAQLRKELDIFSSYKSAIPMAPHHRQMMQHIGA